ncbi:di/tricarboxylate transporter [Litorivivens lipolytica]|uniref:Di/tricarboxylate transporter n=1 Tax=Litorivivens lipolytica TaxID=1524264 RepID=A0A7W4W3K5_9GAMM|nr:di/tricarboxylate transporter [Litorivivens lipolytica]
MLTPDAITTLLVIATCFAMLSFTRWPVDMILLGGAAVLVFLGILTPEEALAGAASEGLATVAVLFVVAQALSDTGVVNWISYNLLGRPKSTAAAQLRLMLPVAAFSSVLNNTPVVAMMVPAVRDWARRNGFSNSQLMIPLSYAAIIGGTCTIVGTSTNLVVNDMLKTQPGVEGLALFDLAWVGVPCVLVVILLTVATSRWLLPDRGGQVQRFEDARQYVVEMLVDAGSPLCGKSIEAAGLRQLPGMFLVEIDRDGRVLTAVSPREVLQANDRLIFAGDVRSVVDLKNIHGLRVADDQVFKLDARQSARSLVEVVISPNFPHLGKTVRDMGFRNHYGAAIIAISRDGQHLKVKIGDVALRPGDTLLLETHEDFVENQRYSRDFLLVSQIENSRPVRHEQRGTAAFILLGMVAVVGTGLMTMFKAVVLAAGLLILTRCVRVRDARRSIDWEIVLVIAASIALGAAMEKSGAARSIAEMIIGLSAGSPVALLAALFALTAAFSAVISNMAAAVILFPVAIAASQGLGIAPEPLAVTLMIGASTCFMTPIGYQTNLMVYGPGNYQFQDFIKMGVPLTLAVGAVTVAVVPLIWPF